MIPLAMSSFLSSEPAHSRFLLYSKGKTATYTSRLDPRCCFCLYIPSTHPIEHAYNGSIGDKSKTCPLVVLMHHAMVNGHSLRDSWSDWAEQQQCVLLVPIFPYTISQVCISRNIADWQRSFHDYYKYMRSPDDPEARRYDLLLLDMVDQVNEQWGSTQTDRFCIAGYSAGGQVSV